ncbi:MAG: methyltransferase domain-containing protein [Candidatus Woesearchaeota archaeon]|nr:MAG: methyltransferase domain-containing protein [Candidatus Woesearchaeota archaeon]
MKISSFDLIGPIAILSERTKNSKKTANYLLKAHKNIKTVLIKTGKYKGLYRLPKLKFIAGVKTTKTIYRENKCVFSLDLSTCYFSPRTASERLRIANQVKKNEIVLNLFSGISPFSIVVSKNSNPKEITDIEINKEAAKYAKENLKLNKINNIKVLKGNVKNIVPKLKKKFDRIIMHLPKTSKRYVPLALKVLKKNGTLHYYFFAKKPRIQFKGLKQIKISRLNQVSPGKYKFCIDFKKL